jgi:hypothetical protein
VARAFGSRIPDSLVPESLVTGRSMRMLQFWGMDRKTYPPPWIESYALAIPNRSGWMILRGLENSFN